MLLPLSVSVAWNQHPNQLVGFTDVSGDSLCFLFVSAADKSQQGERSCETIPILHRNSESVPLLCRTKAGINVPVPNRADQIHELVMRNIVNIFLFICLNISFGRKKTVSLRQFYEYHQQTFRLRNTKIIF